MTEEGTRPDGMVWYQEMPIMRNRFLWWDLLKIGPILPIATFAILAWDGFVAGGTGSEMWIVGLACATSLAACVVGVVGSSIVYGDRWGCTYRIDASGVSWEAGARERKVADALGEVATRIANITGRGGRRSLSRDVGGMTWRTIRRATFHPAERVISISNSWRVVVRLYVLSDDWDAVADWVRWGLAEGRRERAARSQPPSVAD
jgi:hypothetical protein